MQRDSENRCDIGEVSSSGYRPIDCGYYDQLEVFAMRRQECNILFLDKHDQQQSITAVIVNVFAKNKEEFLELESGLKIRLDHLIAVNDQRVPGR